MLVSEVNNSKGMALASKQVYPLKYQHMAVQAARIHCQMNQIKRDELVIHPLKAHMDAWSEAVDLLLQASNQFLHLMLPYVAQKTLQLK